MNCVMMYSSTIAFAVIMLSMAKDSYGMSSLREKRDAHDDIDKVADNVKTYISWWFYLFIAVVILAVIGGVACCAKKARESIVLMLSGLNIYYNSKN